MSDENKASEADTNADLAPASDADTQPAPDATDSPEPWGGGFDAAEAPEGGLLGDNTERKPTANTREVEALRAGEARITREQLAEIKLRRAQHDLETLIAACTALLDELEGQS